MRVTQPGPSASFDQRVLDEGTANERLEVTLTHGDHIRADQLLIVGTEPVDLGRDNTPPNGGFATAGEKLTEGDDQTAVGEYWTSSESLLIGGVDGHSGLTVRVVWNPTEVDKDDQGGRASSDSIGESSVIIWRYTAN